ncbi:Aste57867_11074 [Aphanomyces stellatus]|uniref:Aste57867_11074 protein n=1 Tax=Aphanomyces stellatus TaxID=120398 RepID=A0A485KRX6_9STRA|nr:hypothetical protein As57867_011032 [Aphanomyces stellatus]VFT87941.1 Aste57867_11074 [Aphanomyces stellatus]
MPVGVFLRQDADGDKVGLRRASNTCVRLEPSAMSPGVASINFDAVVECPADELFHQLVHPCLVQVISDGRNVSVVAAGCISSGKSQLMHGSKEDDAESSGLIGRCLEAVFECVHAALLADATRITYVEMSHAWVVESQPDDDPFSRPAFHGVRSSDDALRRYRDFLADRPDIAAAHCVVTCRVQTYVEKTGVVTAGSLVCVDVTGSAMIALPGERAAMEYFPCSAALSAQYGDVMGATFLPCLVLGLRTHATYQQQAIQSLLYACRVKDMTESPAPIIDTDGTMVLSKLLGCVAQGQEADARDFVKTHLPKLNYGTQSRHARAIDRAMPQVFIKQPVLPPTSPAMTTSSSDDDDDDADGVIKGRQSYELVSASSVSVRLYDETLQALKAEKALTERCAARIARLNECIKYQRAAQEMAEAAAREAERQLGERDAKLQHVEAVVGQLQADVARLRRKDTPETMSLQQFSSRLSKVIDETKQVVAMKDAYISQLEAKLHKLPSTTQDAIDEAVARADAAERALAVAQETHERERRLWEARAGAAIARAEAGERDMQLLQTAKDMDAARRSAELQAIQRAADAQAVEWRTKVDGLEQELEAAAVTKERLEQDAVAERAMWQAQLQARESQADADASQWRAKMDALECQMQTTTKAQQEAMVEKEAAWKEAMQEEWQAKVDAVQATAVDERDDWAKRERAWRVEKEQAVASMQATVDTLVARCHELEGQATEARDVLEQQVRCDNEATARADAMIQAMILEVEQHQRREDHLVAALAEANRHESKAKQQLEETRVAARERRRESLLLHAILSKTEHSLRVLEQRHAYLCRSGVSM